MVKKKIKDLSQKEINNYCEKHNCEECCLKFQSNYVYEIEVKE